MRARSSASSSAVIRAAIRNRRRSPTRPTERVTSCTWRSNWAARDLTWPSWPSSHPTEKGWPPTLDGDRAHAAGSFSEGETSGSIVLPRRAIARFGLKGRVEQALVEQRGLQIARGRPRPHRGRRRTSVHRVAEGVGGCRPPRSPALGSAAGPCSIPPPGSRNRRLRSRWRASPATAASKRQEGAFEPVGGIGERTPSPASFDARQVQASLGLSHRGLSACPTHLIRWLAARPKRCAGLRPGARLPQTPAAARSGGRRPCLAPPCRTPT